jgi:dipeptidyl aminopeptidase/acylaminoacyl peptidase
MRQMRYGWHPRRGYSLFHSYHQRLVQLGYVVLSVNFRGGIGYGKEFLNSLHMKMGVDEVIDVINGGKYLQAQSFVDPERVGVWGLSYGGYMTLHALGKHPGTFCMGINVAGVFNWETQIKIYNGRGSFVRFMGGTPEESPEAYRVGSPITYVQNIDVPLFNLQGTADRNVPFSQMDEIVKCMVKYNLDFEVMYYPDQVHVFQDGDVWRNAFPKIEKFFEMHLKNKSNK